MEAEERWQGSETVVHVRARRCAAVTAAAANKRDRRVAMERAAVGGGEVGSPWSPTPMLPAQRYR